jgi:hypothetical protein
MMFSALYRRRPRKAGLGDSLLLVVPLALMAGWLVICLWCVHSLIGLAAVSPAEAAPRGPDAAATVNAALARAQN